VQTWAAIVLIAGAVLFFMAAFSPISMRVFRMDITPEEQIQIVTDGRTAWVISSVLFGAGSIVAVLGLFLFARAVSGSLSVPTTLIAYGAAIISLVGAIFWVVVVYLRITHTPEQIFLEGSLGGQWMFPLYTILTQVALIAFGFVLLQTEYPVWLGWGVITLVSLTVIGAIIFRDMPPFVHYIWLLIVGCTVLLSSSPRLTAAAASVIGQG
jgi:hypothetical protein